MRLPVRQPVDPLNPAEILEAKAAGLVNAPQALSLLDSYIAKEFPEKKIVELIKNLSEAADTKFNQQVGFWTTPNWSAKKNSLDFILKLRGFMQNDVKKAQAPTKVVFNTVVLSGEKVQRTNQNVRKVKEVDASR